MSLPKRPSEAFSRLPPAERRSLASNLLNAFVDIRRVLEAIGSEQGKTVSEMIAEADVRQQVERSIVNWRRELNAARRESGQSPWFKGVRS